MVVLVVLFTVLASLLGALVLYAFAPLHGGAVRRPAGRIPPVVARRPAPRGGRRSSSGEARLRARTLALALAA